MGHVYNSVQQIMAEVNEMINLTEECEQLDIKMLASNLKEEADKLYALWNSNPEKEREIEAMKVKVEETGIRLEFYIVRTLHELEDRYNRRKEAEKIYNYCRLKVLTLKDATEKEVLDWSIYSRWALKYYARSLHILFELEDADMKCITDIRNMMREEV